MSFSFPAAIISSFSTPATTWLGDGNGTGNGRYLTATNVQYVNLAPPHDLHHAQPVAGLHLERQDRFQVDHRLHG
ncbi:MAG: hypothetical protein WDN45_06155 [Caulobacteraceae bacterium]